MKDSSSAFRTYILKNLDINDKFRKHNSKSTRTVRFETEYGKQAQVDWKESFQVILKDLSKVEINIFTYLLSNSRYRVNILSLSKSRKVLFDFLDKSFNITGGVPKEILFDNMKTVMDESRTKNSEGKINNEFNQFAKDYGFKPNICMAKRPQTKGKVEATMKVIDQIMAYNGDLDYDGLLKLVQKINDEENIRFHQSYQKIPVKHLEKEKAFLQPLPQESIRKQYKLKTHSLKVDNTSLITYQNNKYSLPCEYIGKIIDVQQIDDMLYMYCSTKLITFHQISKNNINYYEKHYRELLKAKNYRDDKINEMIKNNTCIIGENDGKNSL